MNYQVRSLRSEIQDLKNVVAIELLHLNLELAKLACLRVRWRWPLLSRLFIKIYINKTFS